MKIKRKAYIAAVAAMIAATACSQSLDTTFTNQENRIDTFINSELASNEGSSVVRNNGANRLILTEGTGEPLGEDGSVSFYYAGYVFNGSISAANMFATNRKETAEDNNWTVTDPDYSILTIRLSDQDIVSGLRNGLKGVREGETCYIVFSGKYGFGKKPVGTIPANSALLYHVWVEKVSN